MTIIKFKVDINKQTNKQTSATVSPTCKYVCMIKRKIDNTLYECHLYNALYL